MSRLAAEMLQSLNPRIARALAARILRLAEGDDGSKSFGDTLDMRLIEEAGYRIVYRSTATEAKVMRIEAKAVFVPIH